MGRIRLLVRRRLPVLLVLPAYLMSAIGLDAFAVRSDTLTPSTSPVKIPGHLGRITDFQGPAFGRPTITLVQDLHANTDAQLKIWAILRELHKSSGVSDVFLEGAYGPFDLSPLSDLAERKIRREVTRIALDQLLICGAEAAAANEPSLQLWGVDDRALYLKNLQAFSKAARHSPAPHPKNPAWREYYSIAEARNQPIVENLLRHLNAIRKSGRPAANAALVVGGFHTAGITRLLADRGVGYIVITPAVKEFGEEHRYARRVLALIKESKYNALAIASALAVTPFVISDSATAKRALETLVEAAIIPGVVYAGWKARSWFSPVVIQAVFLAALTTVPGWTQEWGQEYQLERMKRYGKGVLIIGVVALFIATYRFFFTDPPAISNLMETAKGSIREGEPLTAIEDCAQDQAVELYKFLREKGVKIRRAEALVVAVLKRVSQLQANRLYVDLEKETSSLLKMTVPNAVEIARLTAFLRHRGWSWASSIPTKDADAWADLVLSRIYTRKPGEEYIDALIDFEAIRAMPIVNSSAHFNYLPEKRADEVAAQIKAGEFKLSGQIVEAYDHGVLKYGPQVLGPVDRAIAEEFGIWHMTSNAFVVPHNVPGEVMIRRRSADEWRFPGFLSPFGGHVLWGKSRQEELLRIVTEQLGLPPHLRLRPEQIVELGKERGPVIWEGMSRLPHLHHNNNEIRYFNLLVLDAAQWAFVRSQMTERGWYLVHLDKLTNHRDAVEIKLPTGKVESVPTTPDLLASFIHLSDYKDYREQLKEATNYRPDENNGLRKTLASIMIPFVLLSSLFANSSSLPNRSRSFLPRPALASA
jgi:hypothetical protein